MGKWAIALRAEKTGGNRGDGPKKAGMAVWKTGIMAILA